MKIKSLLAVSVILATQFAFADSGVPQSPPPSARVETSQTPSTSPAQQLSQSDAEKAFGVLFVAQVTEEFPAAEYAKIKDIMCNLDKVQLVRYNLAEAAATSCSFKKESGEEVVISGSEAMKLKEILLANNCEVEETSQYALVKAKELEINHDRIQQSISGSIKK